MKKIITSVALLSGVMVFSQQTGRVGINNSTPSATLNVKSKTGTNAKTKNLELENAKSEKLVTVLDNGNVGIGTQTPSEKLEIKGKIKITDGTQSTVKVLTSDANGVGTWHDPTQTIIQNISVTSLVDYNILGYVPSTTATASTAPISTKIGNITTNKVSFGTFSGNGHSYAAYSTNSVISWYQAYELAKRMRGI